MIVVTRPSPAGEVLAQMLQQQHINALHLPLFSIDAGQDLSHLQYELEQLNFNDAVIVASPQVANIIQQYDQVITFPNHIDYFTVGKKSAQSLQPLLKQKVNFPHNSEDSEGLLQLLSNREVKHSNILILRGNSGRELLFQQLTKRGANVKFLQCYYRNPIHYNKLVLSTDVSKLIITATSVENLLQLEPLCNIQHKTNSRLLVSSTRIYAQAKQLKWQNIILTAGANNQILFKTIVTLCHNAKQDIKLDEV